MFRIFETDAFTRRLEALVRSGHRSIESKLKHQIYPQLRQSPYFGPHIRKLRDYQPETWRYRTGDYRVFFVIDDANKVVRVLSIDARKDAYR